MVQGVGVTPCGCHGNQGVGMSPIVGGCVHLKGSGWG